MQSVSFYIDLNILGSSVNINIGLVTFEGKLLMQITNSSSSNTDPWETPLHIETDGQLEYQPFNTTHYLLSIKTFLIQTNYLSVMPNVLSF